MLTLSTSRNALKSKVGMNRPVFIASAMVLSGDIPDVRLPVFQPGDLVLIEIDTHDFEAGRGDL